MAEVFDRVGSCKENVRRNIRYLIELRAVKEFVSRMARYSIELVVRSCKEVSVRRNSRILRYLI